MRAPPDRLRSGVYGAMARGLGVLASVLGRHDDAQRHFETAVEIERRMGGRPWLAHAHHGLAATLLARGHVTRAEEQRDAALALYRELGMEAWAARASALG